MEEPSQEDIMLINQCFNLIRSSDNQNVKEATETIDTLATNPRSIPIFIRFYELQNGPEHMTPDSKTLRQFSLISLKSAIKNCWSTVPPELRIQLYQHFLSLLIHESEWLLRRYLIDCIIAVSADFDEILLGFVKQAGETGDDAYLEIALTLASTLPNNTENLEIITPYIPFFAELFMRAFASNQPEVRFSGFHFLCHSELFKDARIFEQQPEFWEKCIELINAYVTAGKDIPRIVNLFNYALDEGIYTGQPLSLLHNLMSYFAAEPPIDPQVLLQLHSIIQNICSHYAESFDETVLVPLIQLHLSLSARLYVVDDSLALSEAAFFEEAIRALCVTPESIEILWTICGSCIESDEGRFFFLRAIASTFSNAHDFYLEHLTEINELLQLSINSESNLLRNAAARTANDLIEYYVYENDEIAIELIPIVSNACLEKPSSDLIHLYSRLLETTQKTDDYFEQSYPFLVGLVTSVPEPDLQEAALQCLKALAFGSVTKINRAYLELLPMISEILKSSQPQICFLKVPAVDLIAALAIVIDTDQLDEFLSGIMHGFVEFLQQEDVTLVLSTIQALQVIIRFHPQTTLESLPQIIPILIHYAETNLTNLAQSYHELNSDDTMLPDTKCKLVGYSMHALSEITGVTEFQERGEILKFVFQCFYAHKLCSNEIIKSFIAKSFSTLLEYVDPDIPAIKELIERVTKEILIPSLLISTPETESNYHIVMAFYNIAYYTDYTYIIIPEPYIIESIMEFLDPQIAISYRPKDRNCDLYDAIIDFFSNLFVSLSGYLEQFPNLDEISNQFLAFFAVENAPRLHSYAIRFFGYYLYHHKADSPPDEIQCKVIEQAIKMATEGNEYAPFQALYYIGVNTETVFKPYLTQLYPIFLEKLKLPCVKTDKMLFLRDNCLFAFSKFFLIMFDADSPLTRTNREEICLAALEALPIDLDFDYKSYDFKMDSVCDMIITIYDKSTIDPYLLQNHVLRILVVMFANPKKMIKQMKIDQTKFERLVSIVKDLLSELSKEEIDNLKEMHLNNDETKYQYLLDVLENGLYS